MDDSSIEILMGPAQCGKTTTLLVDYARVFEQAVREQRRGRCLWLAPTSAVCQALRRRFARECLAASLAPNFNTFNHLGEWVIARSSRVVRPISAAQKQEMLRTIIGSLGQESPFLRSVDQGSLDALVRKVSDEISELKRLEIWPEHLQQGWEGLPHISEQAQLLHQVYSRYQQILNEFRLYDQEGKLWSARESLRLGELPQESFADLVVIDGFSDFSRTQLDIIEFLAKQTRRLVITLPLDGPCLRNWQQGRSTGDQAAAARAELFAKPLATLNALAGRFKDRLQTRLYESQQAPSPVARWEGRLFHMPNESFPPTAEDSVAAEADHPLKLCGEISGVAECRAVARRILSLVDQGVPPEEILIVSRHANAKMELMAEVLDEYCVPATCERELPLDRFPAVRHMLSLFELPERDWPYRELLAVVTNAAWPTPISGDRKKLSQTTDRQAAELAIRRAQLPNGRDALLARIESWSERTDLPFEPRRAAAVLRGLALWLEEALLPRSLTKWCELLHEWVGLVVDGSASERSDREAIDDTASVDLRLSPEMNIRALQQWIESLAALQQVPAWTGIDPAELTLPQWIALARENAATEQVSCGQRPDGKVRIVSAMAARCLSAEHLFIIGMQEDVFPSAESRHHLIGDALRSQLYDKGVPLPDHARRLEDEMLLFYQVIMRARRSVVISYTAFDSKGNAQQPSPYVQELQAALGAAMPVTLPKSLAPRVEQDPHSLREIRLAGVQQAVEQGNVTVLERLLTDREGFAVAKNLASSLSLTHSRSERDKFGSGEGVLTSEAARRRLAERFGTGVTWNATWLERFAECPFRFFGERLLELQPLDDLELATDNRRRGQWMHQLFAIVLHEMRERNLPSLSQQVDESVFDELCAVALNRVEQLAGPSLTADLQRELHEKDLTSKLRWFRTHQATYESPANKRGQPAAPTPLPIGFEIRFGPARRQKEQAEEPEEDESPLSSDEPLVLKTPDEEFRLTGRVDRVDLLESEAGRFFNVIDYKSSASRKFTIEDARAGRQLQPLLYALAVEQLLSDQTPTLPWEVGYWLAGKQPGKSATQWQALQLHELDESGSPTETAAWQEIRPQLAHLVARIAEHIRDGQFPVYNANEDCKSYCELSTICRIDQVRALDKTWSVQEEGNGEG